MRFPSLSLRISGYEPSKMVAIREAAGNSLPWDWCNTEPGEDMYGDVHSCIITDVGLFLLLLLLKVWTANGGYCTVTVSFIGPDGDVKYEISKEEFFQLVRELKELRTKEVPRELG